MVQDVSGWSRRRPAGAMGRGGRALAMIATLAVWMAVAACGGADEPSATGDGSEVASDGGGAPAELTVWFAREYFVPPAEHLERFEQETGVAVTVDVQADDDLFQQLIRMRDAGEELPDIVHLDGFLRPVVAEAGVVVPIQQVADEWAADDPDTYEQVYAATWDEGMWDGELVGMANSASMEEVYLRTDWLAEAGVTELPTTWDGVLDAARAIKQVQPDVTPFGWWAVRGSGANHVFASMTAMGVQFDGSIPDLRSDAGRYWIDFVQTLAREELAHPEAIAWNDDDMRGGFIGSGVGMMLDSAPTALDAIDAGLTPDEQFQLVPMPTSRSGEDGGVVTAPARTFHVTTDGADVMHEAGLFLRLLMERDVALDVMRLGGDPHRTAAVLDDPDAVESWVPIWDDDNVAAFSDLGVFPVDIEYPSSEGLMEELNQFALDNPDMDAAAVAEQWQPRFDELAGS